MSQARSRTGTSARSDCAVAAPLGWLVGRQPEAPHPAHHVGVAVDAGLRPDDAPALRWGAAGKGRTLSLVGRPHVLQIDASVVGHAQKGMSMKGEL